MAAVVSSTSVQLTNRERQTFSANVQTSTGRHTSYRHGQCLTINKRVLWPLFQVIKAVKEETALQLLPV